jgi:hypothetical protein
LIAAFSATLQEQKFHKIVVSIYYLLVLLVFISYPLISLQLVHRKSMIFFSEPSHFALAFGPFLFYMMACSGKLKWHFIIGCLLGVLLKKFDTYSFLLIAKQKKNFLSYQYW